MAEVERRQPPAIVLQHVGLRFGDVVGLHDVTLDIAPGQLVGLIGPSGSGKSTAIRLVAGALRPQAGEVWVLGQRPARLPAAMRARLGVMPQRVSLYDELTVGENVDFVAALYGLLPLRRRRRVRATLEWLGLSSVRTRRASELSGGQKRRLQLACALVHDPQVLLLDEPLAGVDPLLRQRIWAELHRLRAGGRAIVVATQYVAEADHCDRVALLDGGRLVASAPPGALRHALGRRDRVEIELQEPFDPARLPPIPGLRSIKALTPTVVRADVDDASRDLPAVLAALRQVGGEPIRFAHRDASLDDVFTDLVARARGGGTGAGTSGNSAEPRSGTRQ